MNTLTHTHVTIVKTLLNDTYMMNLIEIISQVLYYLLYAIITIPLMLILLSSLIQDTRILRDLARREREGDPDTEK